MPKTAEAVESQLEIFSEQPTVKEEQQELDEIVNISHEDLFRMIKIYLLENLPQYNKYLKRDPPASTASDKEKAGYSRYLEGLKDDNLLLRAVFGGIKNSWGTPPEIFDGLNALEICLMEAGILKRKFVYFDDLVIQPRDMHKEPIRTRRDPSKYSEKSRIEIECNLEGISLYEIMLHLLTASKIRSVYGKYKKDWKEIFQTENPNKKQKRFKTVNPYDPETLRGRMDSIERDYPDAVAEFKEVLKKPFIPERIVARCNSYGYSTRIINEDGFVTPGKTYKKGVRGKSVWRLEKYADEIRDYFRIKESSMQKRN